jgi:hypothetical protein
MASITDGPFWTTVDGRPVSTRSFFGRILAAARRYHEAHQQRVALRKAYEELADLRMCEDVGLPPPPNATIRHHWLMVVISE